MAGFVETGLNGLQLSMAELAKLPDALISDMLVAGGEVVARYQSKEIGKLNLVDSGKLRASIKVDKKYRVSSDGNEHYVNVYPQGEHHSYSGRRKTKAYKRSKHGRTYSYGGGTKTATNQDVGFVHEFGAKKRGIKASGWMRSANEQAQVEAVAAQKKVYEAHLDKLGL